MNPPQCKLSDAFQALTEYATSNKCKDDIRCKSDIVKEIPGGPPLLLPHLKTWGRISWDIGGVQSRALLGLLLAAGRRPQPRLLRARHVVAPLLPELPPALRGLCQPGDGHDCGKSGGVDGDHDSGHDGCHDGGHDFCL